MEDGTYCSERYEETSLTVIGDPQALEQWTRFRELSIEKLKETYARLNIHFDLYHGESKVQEENIERAMRIMEEKGMLCEDRGALLADLTKYKMDRAIVRKGGMLPA